MLFLVARGHHVAHFGVGQHALIADHIVLVCQIGGKSGKLHVKAIPTLVVETHGLVCQTCVAQGAVNRVFPFQDLISRRMERAGVDDAGSIQENAVEMEIRISDEGGINGDGRGYLRLFQRNRILNRFL